MSSLGEALNNVLIGQPEFAKEVVPCIQTHMAGFGTPGRPVGAFLLLGPTGSGKTFSVEALAEVLHGDSKRVLRIDCGTMAQEGDVARFVGSPSGFVGHKSTPPLISEYTLKGSISEHCSIPIVLFDEIEKSYGILASLLLSILDKGVLQLADNSTVNMEDCLIFFSSNLGARQLLDANKPSFGFGREGSQADQQKLQKIGEKAAQRVFSPEFFNRLDATIVYRPLDREATEEILNRLLVGFRETILRRLGTDSFKIGVSDAAFNLLLDKGVSVEYGARELKRVLKTNFIQPVTQMWINKQIPVGSRAVLDVTQDGEFFIQALQLTTHAVAC